MNIDIDFDVEIDVTFDSGTRDILIILDDGNTKLTLHMDSLDFSKLLKEMNEFTKGMNEYVIRFQV